MIWNIQIQKHGRDPKDFDLVQLARATEGLTGNEIENAFVESLYQAFDEESEPTDLTVARVLTNLVPLAVPASSLIVPVNTMFGAATEGDLAAGANRRGIPPTI